MFQSSGERFIVNRQVDDGFIGMVNRVGDRVETDFARFPIPSKYVIANLDFADWFFAVLGGDFRIRAEAKTGVTSNGVSKYYKTQA